MANRFSCRDRHGALVVCTERTWVGHEAKHPEIAGAEAWVVQTISNPEREYQDADHHDRRALYRRFTFSDLELGVLWLKVVVEYRRNRRHGYVVTAYTLDAPKPSEVLLWTNPNA